MQTSFANDSARETMQELFRPQINTQEEQIKHWSVLHRFHKDRDLNLQSLDKKN